MVLWLLIFWSDGISALLMNNRLVFIDGEVISVCKFRGAVKPSIVVAAGLFLTAWEGLVQVWKGICVS